MGGVRVDDGYCVRGCTVPAAHLAACDDYGVEGDVTCQGCAPAPTPTGLAVCDRCLRAFRRMLVAAPDVFARLRSLGDPTKAIVYEDRARVSGSGSPEAPAPVKADELDAARAIADTLWIWSGGAADAAFDAAVRSSREMLRSLEHNLSEPSWALHLASRVLDRHEPDADGVREAWSIADAHARWGVERRERPDEIAGTPSRALRPSPEYDEDTATPIPEGDPLILRSQAAVLAGSLRTLQRWEQAGEIAHEGVIYAAGVRTRIYRRSTVLAVQARMDDEQRAARFKTGEKTA